MVSDQQLYRHAAEARNVWLTALPDMGEVPHHQFSARFERKMKKLLRMQHRSPTQRKTAYCVKRGIVIVLAAIIVTFSALMTVTAYRVKVIEAIVHVFNELTDYRFSTQQSTGSLPDVQFGYVPDGMVEIETDCHADYRYVRYENDAGKLFELTQSLLISDGSYQKILDTEDAETEHFMMDGEDAVANTKNGDSTVIWSRQNVLYQLFGNLPMEELIKIAKNIK